MKKGLLLLSVVGLWIACSETHIDEPTLAPDRPATKADTTRNWTGYMSYKDGTGQIANWNAVPASGGTFSLFVSTPYYYPNGQSTPVYANEGTIALSAERDTVGSGSYPLGFAFVDPATIPYTGGFIASFLIYPNETGSDRKGCIVASYKGVKFRQNFTQSGDGLPWPKGFSVAGYSTTSTHNSFYMPQAEAWYPLTINCPSGTTWSCSSTGSVLTISRTNTSIPEPVTSGTSGTYYVKWTQIGSTTPQFVNITFFCRGIGIDVQFYTRL